MTTEIKPARTEDAAALSRIHAWSWKQAYRGIVPQGYLDELPPDHWTEAVTGWIKDHRFHVDLLWLDGQPVGGVIYGKSTDERWPEDGEIVSLYLLPEQMGKGHGRKLTDHALDVLAQEGYSRCFLWTFRDNARAIGFYNKLGFASTGAEIPVEFGETLIGVHYSRALQTDAIIYRDTKQFAPQALADLFLSVDWSSGHFPERLTVAMTGCSTVYSAWHGEKLVGLISVMADGGMNAYIHYLLVRPEYQDRGIGRRLVQMVTDTYKDYMRIVLIAYEKEVSFYQRCGFEAGEGKIPMSITTLWT